MGTRKSEFTHSNHILSETGTKIKAPIAIHNMNMSNIIPCSVDLTQKA